MDPEPHVIAIIWALAIGAPVAFVGPRRRVENYDAMVYVAVRDIHFVCWVIDGDTRGTAKVFSIVAAAVLTWMPDLEQKLALRGELQNLIVFRSGPAHPYMVVEIDIDSVHELGPVISGARTAPCSKQRAVGRKFENRRNRIRRPVHDPDILVAIDGDTTNST